MSTEEQAREAMAKQRQQTEHLQESMLNRAEAEVKQSRNAAPNTEEQAREVITKQRQQGKNLQESMLNRTEAEFDTSSTDVTDSSSEQS